MKHIKLFFFLLSGILISLNVAGIFYQGEIPEGVSAAIRNGNAVALSKYFNDKIELTINDMDDIYSRDQAELIMKDFFANHMPNSFNILHKGGKEGSRFAIGSLNTTGGEYRITILVKYTNNQPFIHQLRIEKENGQ